MKNTVLILALLFTLFFIGCGQKSQEKEIEARDAKSQKNIIKVFVDSLGIISADSKTITLSDLDKKLEALKKKDGMVYYSRDNSLQAPPKEAEQTIEMIAKYTLPIKFFTAKTFSEVVEFK